MSMHLKKICKTLIRIRILFIVIFAWGRRKVKSEIAREHYMHVTTRKIMLTFYFFSIRPSLSHICNPSCRDSSNPIHWQAVAVIIHGEKRWISPSLSWTKADATKEMLRFTCVNTLTRHIGPITLKAGLLSREQGQQGKAALQMIPLFSTEHSFPLIFSLFKLLLSSPWANPLHKLATVSSIFCRSFLFPHSRIIVW